MTQDLVSKNKNLESIVFWGALWGLAEAVLGSLLHILPWTAGMVMFPIGFYCMKKALNDTGNLAALFYTSSIAAGIKLAGLILPWQSPGQVIKPVIWILIEGAAVVLFFKLFDYAKNPGRTFSFAEIMPLSLSWRLAYMIYYLAAYIVAPHESFQQMSGLTLARFLVIESMVNAAFIFFYLKFEKYERKAIITRWLKPSFVSSLSLLAIALFTRFML